MSALVDKLVPNHGRLVVLSPHLDDAALSCGALMAAVAREGDVVAITIFDGDPEGPLSAAASDFHHACGHGDDAMSHRRAEDDKALARLGAVPMRLGLPEALYRRDVLGQARYPAGHDIFGPGLDAAPDTAIGATAGPHVGHPSGLDVEPDVVELVARQLRNLVVLREADLVLAPLAIGGHVDHRIVAGAARRLERPVWWYEDVPYALYDRCRDWQGLLGPAGPAVGHTSSGDWAAKLDAIDCYGSQHAVLWDEPDQFRRVLTTYGTSVGTHGRPAERYWNQLP